MTQYTLKLGDMILDGQPVKPLTQGVKNDSGKLRYDLIPPEAMDSFAEVYTIGARKYADRNWELGMSWGRVFSAMLRHAFKWLGGESYDAVDGQHHLASVMWCAASLIAYEARSMTQWDDRKPVKGDNA